MPAGDAIDPVLYAHGDYRVRRRPADDLERFDLLCGGLYVEFSTVQRLDTVWLLHDAADAAYMSIQHSAGDENDIPASLDVLLGAIEDGDL